MRSAYNKEIYYNQFKKIMNLDEPNEVLPFSNAILSLTGNTFPVSSSKKVYNNPDKSFKLLFPVLNCGVYFIWNHYNYSIRKYDYTIDTDLEHYNEMDKYDLVIMRYLDDKTTVAKIPKRKYKDVSVLLKNVYNFLRMIERREPKKKDMPISKKSITVDDLKKPTIVNTINKKTLKELRDTLIDYVLDDVEDDFFLISKAIEKFFDIDDDNLSFLNASECKRSDILFMNKDTILRMYRVYNRNGKYKYTTRLIDRNSISNRFNLTPIADKEYVFAISHNNRTRFISENNKDTNTFKKMGMDTDDHFNFMMSTLSAVFMEAYLSKHGSKTAEEKSYISDEVEVDFSETSTRIEIKDNISISALEEIIEDTNIFNGVDNGVLEFISDCIRDIGNSFYCDISSNKGGDETLFFVKFHKNGCYYKIMSSYDDGSLSLEIANDFELYINMNSRRSLSFSFYIGDVYGDNEIYILDSTEYDNDEFLDNFRKAIKFYLYQRENKY